nr:MAG TPA: hypothetical protein [Caudoviricetes sp.]
MTLGHKIILDTYCIPKEMLYSMYYTVCKRRNTK